MRVLVTGTLSYDFIMDFSGRFVDRIMPDKIHNISLSFLADKLSKQFGGTAGNITYSANLLGVTPVILATAGNDFVPYHRFFAGNKISTRYIKTRPDVPTSSYFVITDRDDNQIGSFYLGASKYNKHLSISHIREKVDFAIIAPNDPQAIIHFIDQCRTTKIPYMYDPAFQISVFTPQQLRTGITGAQILIGNDYEIALIEQKLEITHEELILMVPILITTLGSKGSVIETRTDAIHIRPARVKNTSDPTGAGDAYRAGFVAGYLRGFGLDVCGQMGSVTAAYTVEKYGTVTHRFTKKAFIRRYQENYKRTIAL